jgi:hypothetical protein
VSSILTESTSYPYEPTFRDALAVKIRHLKNWIKNNALTKYSFKHLWVSGSLASFATIALITAIYPMQVMPKINHKYSIFASTPLRLGSTTYEIYSKDARSQKINFVFKEYNCPLEGMGEAFVYEADKHSIPWWLVAAISFQESSCGKMTPEPGGVESYNAWGWAVYGDNVQTFDNWARGIETVSQYMANNFFAKNITDPCEIMKTYTPPSKGSWCEGVKYFGDIIQNYTTPTDRLGANSLTD